MTLTDEIFTTERPTMVKTVEITEGKVFHASAHRLIIHTKEGEAVLTGAPCDTEAPPFVRSANQG